MQMSGCRRASECGRAARKSEGQQCLIGEVNVQGCSASDVGFQHGDCGVSDSFGGPSPSTNRSKTYSNVLEFGSEEKQGSRAVGAELTDFNINDRCHSRQSSSGPRSHSLRYMHWQICH